MKAGKRITRSELQRYIECMQTIFDTVRVVDPYEVEVLTDGKEPVKTSNVCYKIWDKNSRCSNCISFKSYTEFERKTKYEFRGDDGFFVLAYPFMITDEGDRVVVLEMVNEVTEEIQVKCYGEEIIAKTLNQIDHKLYTDSLTGVFNRRYFDENMYLYENEGAVSRQVGFIILDVTNFKSINDNFGHMTGDKVLIDIARVMRGCIRKEDTLMRVGGDEFLIVTQDCVKEQIEQLILRIKKHVGRIRIPEIDKHVLSIDAGYSYTQDFDSRKEVIQEMMMAADQHMYEDKKSGQIDMS